MAPEQHDKIGEQLSAYLDGELTAEQAAEVERLIAADPQARQRFEDLRRTVEAVQALPRRSAPDGLLDDLTARIERAQLLDGIPERGEPIGVCRRKAWALLASAAVVIFAVGGGFWAFNQMTESTSGPEIMVATLDDERFPLRPEETASAPRRRAKGEDEASRVTLKKTAQIEGAVETDADFRLGIAPSADVDLDHAAPLGERADRLAGAFADSAGKEHAVGQTEAGEAGRRRFEMDSLDAAVLAQTTPQYDPTDPLDIKLRRGVAPADVTEHDFSNEAINLSVSYHSVRDREQAQSRMNAFMVSNRIQSVESAAVNGPVPSSVPFFVQGQVHRNYDEGLNEQQLLVRIPAPQLDALVQEVWSPSDGRMQLEIGPFVVASNPDQIRRMLSDSAAEGGRMRARPAEQILAFAGRSTVAMEPKGGVRIAPNALPDAFRKRIAADKSDAAQPATGPAADRDERAHPKTRAAGRGTAPQAGTSGHPVPRQGTDDAMTSRSGAKDEVSPRSDSKGFTPKGSTSSARRPRPPLAEGESPPDLAPPEAGDLITMVVNLRVPTTQPGVERAGQSATTQPEGIEN